jgi:hypothetical protein
MRRIFEGELIEVKTRAGVVNHTQARGFHFENTEAMARGNSILEHTRSSPDGRGIYRAARIIQGAEWTQHERVSFFPQGWTRKQIVEAVTEAYMNRVPYVYRGQSNFYKGVSTEGMRIVLELDEAGLVLDAFPIRAAINKGKEAVFRVQSGQLKKSKLVCKKCMVVRVQVCPNGHDEHVKKSLLVRMKRRIGRFIGKVWRVLGGQ